MSDSERPNPQMSSFEVPDLELEPVPRSIRRGEPARSGAVEPNRLPRPTSALDQMFGASFEFGDDLDDLEFERSAQPNFDLTTEQPPRPAVRERVAPLAATVEAVAPTGRPSDVAKLEFNPRELLMLADYGEPPVSAASSLAYAYRVFTRQRVLKRQLISLAAESDRADTDREATLAELAGALRPEIEQSPELRGFLPPLLDIEQRAAARGHALSSINAQLDTQQGKLDAELVRLKSEIEAEQRTETEARRYHDDCEASATRSDAKVKRIQIEMRSVTHLVEQKLGAPGGPIPEQDAAQLASLQQRADAMQPEVAQARARFEEAKLALKQSQARLEALGKSQRRIARERQAIVGAYQRELSARAQSVSEAESERRAALAELSRSVLAAHEKIAIPAQWLERVRSVSDRAHALSVRAEMQRRAINAYDPTRARQGVQLACTALGLLLVLCAFKLIF